MSKRPAYAKTRQPYTPKQLEQQRKGRWLHLGESKEEWLKREENNAVVLNKATSEFYARKWKEMQDEK